MKRSYVILLFVALLSAFAIRAETYSERWEHVSAEHDRLISTPKGQQYEQELVAVHNSFWREVFARCSASAKREGIPMFRAVAVVDSTGVVTEFLPMPNSRHFSCFTENMVGKRYPVPPTAPFYERFKIYLSDGKRGSGLALCMRQKYVSLESIHTGRGRTNCRWPARRQADREFPNCCSQVPFNFP